MKGDIPAEHPRLSRSASVQEARRRAQDAARAAAAEPAPTDAGWLVREVLLALADDGRQGAEQVVRNALNAAHHAGASGALEAFAAWLEGPR